MHVRSAHMCTQIVCPLIAGLFFKITCVVMKGPNKRSNLKKSLKNSDKNLWSGLVLSGPESFFFFDREFIKDLLFQTSVQTFFDQPAKQQNLFSGAYNRTTRPALRRLPRGCRCRRGIHLLHQPVLHRQPRGRWWSANIEEGSNGVEDERMSSSPVATKKLKLAASSTPATGVEEVGQPVASGRGRFWLAWQPV